MRRHAAGQAHERGHQNVEDRLRLEPGRGDPGPFQREVERRERVIVGVNRYQLAEEPPVDILNIDNTAVRQMQIEKLNQLKAERDPQKVQETLDALTRANLGDEIEQIWEADKKTCVLITNDVDEDYFRRLELQRNDAAKMKRQASQSAETVEL